MVQMLFLSIVFSSSLQVQRVCDSEKMDQLDSLWSYQETREEMRQKVLYTSLELEKLKMEASEEKRKNNEYVKQLIQLIKMAYQERDEARDQLQKLVNKINQADLLNPPSQIQVDCSLVKATKANSSTIESNSLTETYNYQSQNSSPVESFLDAVTSPELSNINVADSNAMSFINQPIIPVSYTVVPQEMAKVDLDPASLVIESLVKGQTLPQQGKFLQAVLESGPLLQTLLVAGPLPRWRNPPQFQPLHIPPVSIKGCEAGIVTRNNAANSSQPYFEMTCASSQMMSPYLGYQRLVSAGENCSNSFVHLDKRQRLQ